MQCVNCGHDITCIDIGKEKRELLWGHDTTQIVQEYKNGKLTSLTASNINPSNTCYEVLKTGHCGCRNPEPKKVDMLEYYAKQKIYASGI